MLLSSHFSAGALFSAGGLFASVFASPFEHLVVHEKRSEVPHGWAKRDLLDRRAILPMKIALAQSNLDKGYDWLMDVSHPESKQYGEHWSAKEIAEAFKPSDDSIVAVHAWLTSAGISTDRVQLSDSLGWLKFDATVDEAEGLLKTKYHVFEHTETGQPHVACEQYSIPAHLQEHVDLIKPTVHFDAKVKPRSKKRSGHEKRDKIPGIDKGIGRPSSASLPKLGRGLDERDLLSSCANEMTPDCLRALYNFGPNNHANPKNSFGIVELLESYLPSDLDLFFKNYAPHQIGNRPILDSIDGAALQTAKTNNDEPDLDLEYAMTLVYPQKVTLYQSNGDKLGFMDNFLDAIDGSYCTYDGGDDSPPSGFKGRENCGGFAATKVISSCYTYNEHDLTPFYMRRQCNEYMKLGMMGVTFLYASGDNGVAGGGDKCINGPGIPTSGRFTPSFPGTCPYVTSVGATQIIPNIDLSKYIDTGAQPEEACTVRTFRSGGGFSDVFPLPAYQSKAVKSWFANHPPPYGADRFNNSQHTRGYPDISANAANYQYAVDGAIASVDGTSASTPTIGAILTLINQARFDAGKKSIGFINSALYSNPSMLHDITKGSNPGCSTPGFHAAPDWDPATGMGTPNTPKMLDYFMSLK